MPIHNTDKAQLAAQLFFTKAQQRLGDSFEQKRQHDGFVVQSNDVQFMRQCKDDVKVADRKWLLFACPNSRACFISSSEG
jgi:hypothetical protein